MVDFLQTIYANLLFSSTDSHTLVVPSKNTADIYFIYVLLYVLAEAVGILRLYQRYHSVSRDTIPSENKSSLGCDILEALSEIPFRQETNRPSAQCSYWQTVA